MDSLAEDEVTLPLDFDRRYLKKEMSLSLDLFDKLFCNCHRLTSMNLALGIENSKLIHYLYCYPLMILICGLNLGDFNDPFVFVVQTLPNSRQL